MIHTKRPRRNTGASLRKVSAVVRLSSRELDVENHHAAVAGERLRGGEPLAEIAGIARILQWILRRHHPPDLVEREAPQGLAGKRQVPVMDGVERSSEEADAPTLGVRQHQGWDGHDDSSSRLMAALGPQLTGPADLVFERRQLLEADRAARVQLAGGDADLGAEAELAAIGELGRGVVQDDGAVDLGEEALGRRRRPR